MCYGSYDPKYMMRDIEDRMKGVAFAPDKSDTAEHGPSGGLMVLLRAIFRRKIERTS